MATKQQTVAFIGTGSMGGAVLAGSLRGGLKPANVRATTRRGSRAQQLHEEYGVHATTSNPEATDGADLVIIGVEPPLVPEVLQEIRGSLSPDAVVVSLVGGMAVAELEKHLPHGTPVVRTAPNTPASVGMGMVGLAPGTHCTSEQLQTVKRFFELSGEALELTEEQIAAMGALSGSGPAYFFYVADAMVEAGATLGLSRDLARKLVTRTMQGAGAMLDESGEHPVTLREGVSSPGGSTVKVLNSMDERGVRGAIIAAMTKS